MYPTTRREFVSRSWFRLCLAIAKPPRGTRGQAVWQNHRARIAGLVLQNAEQLRQTLRHSAEQVRPVACWIAAAGRCILLASEHPRLLMLDARTVVASERIRRGATASGHRVICIFVAEN